MRRRHTLRSRRDHPRSRGENGKNALLEIRELGSSPLMRGKLHERGHDELARGLIPAHAGKTRRRTMRRG